MNCICNFQYADQKQGGKRFPDVRGLLRYIQYRDDRADHIPNAGGPNRWVDRGLGQSYQQILARLDQLSPANPHAYCHAIMISPDPAAMADIQGDPHARFVQAIHATIEEWDTWRQDNDATNGKPRQAGQIEYSLVIHQPERHYGEQMHAHVIVGAATEHAMTGDMTPLYNNNPQLDAFKEIMYRQLDRVFELKWERGQPEPEQEASLRYAQTVPEHKIEFFPLSGDGAVGVVGVVGEEGTEGAAT